MRELGPSQCNMGSMLLALLPVSELLGHSEPVGRASWLHLKLREGSARAASTPRDPISKRGLSSQKASLWLWVPWMKVGSTYSEQEAGV